LYRILFYRNEIYYSKCHKYKPCIFAVSDIVEDCCIRINNVVRFVFEIYFIMFYLKRLRELSVFTYEMFYTIINILTNIIKELFNYYFYTGNLIL